MRPVRWQASVALIAAVWGCTGGGGGGGGPLPPPCPSVELSATQLDFIAVAGGSEPASQELTVTGSGTGTLAVPTPSVTYHSGAAWLAVTVVGSAAPFTVTVQPSSASLAPGAYTATVSLSCEGSPNSPRDVAVTLTVYDAATPLIGLAPASLTFTTTAGNDPATQEFSVTNAWGGTLNWTASVSETWLSVSPTADTNTGEADAVTVSVVTGALTRGTYGATVTVSDSGAPNSPQTVAVTLEVANTPPSVVVTDPIGPYRWEVAVAYDLVDVDVDSWAIAVEYRGGAAGATWTPATVTGTTDGVAPGAGLTVVWNSAADEPSGAGTDYQIRITPNDGIADGVPAVTGVFSVDNQLDDAEYITIDVSSGPDAEHYHVAGLDAVPPDLLTNDKYRTTTIVLRKVTPGTFTMGSPATELGRDTDETEHQVTLSEGFHVGVFEVTKGQYLKVMGSIPSYDSDDPRYPIRVQWQDARGGAWPGGAPWTQSFLGKLQIKSGVNFDLPTEAQWEYACRAGTTTSFNNGQNITSTSSDAALEDIAWYYYNCDHDPQMVGTKLPNAWGLYDMHGNAGEWCLDWYGPYDAGPLTDPVGPSTGTGHLERGGASYSGAASQRAAGRTEGYMVAGYWTSAIRVVKPASVPVLRLDGGTMHFVSIDSGAAPADQTTTVQNAGSGVPLDWTASTDQAWLSVSPTLGTTTTEIDEITVSATPGSLGTGVYRGTITVTAAAAMNNPQSLDVFLSIEPATPLYVVIDISGGVGAASYPLSYLDSAPADLVTNAEYKTTKIVLRRIPAGTFVMGSPTDEWGRSEGIPMFPDIETQHQVTLTKGFYMGVFEVTQAHYENVAGSNPAAFSGNPDYPVETVSWDVIRGGDWPSGSPSSGGFIGLLCSKTGLSVDLPTEAQWEYACRAGTTEALNNGKNQSGRKRDQASDEVGNYGINWRSFSPEPVGIRLPNAWGLYDMHGNEAEWCLDWYGEYVVAPATDPVGPSSGVERVNRSGAWSFTVECLRSASRIASNSSWAFDFIGFRIAVND